MVTVHAWTSHRIHCLCGALEAVVFYAERSTRAVCYCRDCQAFAHFLGLPDGMLDRAGRPDIVAVRPGNVEFLRGSELLACMSLSPHGTRRWYTNCCRTPLVSTARIYRQSHLGLIHSCLDVSGLSMDDTFKPVRMHVNVKSAKGKPGKSARLGLIAAMLRYLGAMIWSRLSGRYRINPFFGPAGRPRFEPQVLGRAEQTTLFGSI
jgi:hypothetical protein